jgi:hypothetical protein
VIRFPPYWSPICHHLTRDLLRISCNSGVQLNLKVIIIIVPFMEFPYCDLQLTGVELKYSSCFKLSQRISSYDLFRSIFLFNLLMRLCKNASRSISGWFLFSLCDEFVYVIQFSNKAILVNNPFWEKKVRKKNEKKEEGKKKYFEIFYNMC